MPTEEDDPAMAEPSEVFDPASLRIRLRSMRGGDYLDVKWRLVWLREEHPDAIIETEEKGHDPGKWATFRACVRIPNAGSASGHGSETAGDFPDYYEKSETKALGRALAALGYGAQFLPADDEALADSPVDRSGATPTPINRPVNQSPRDKANARYHAVGDECFWSDAALHLFAISEFPGTADKPITSRAQLNAGQLSNLADKIDKRIGRIVTPDGEIVATPEVEYANAIAAAADQKALAAIGAKMKEGGIAADWLRAMYKRRNQEVPAVAGEVK